MRAWYIKAKWLLPIIGTVALVGILYHRLDFHRIANLRQVADWRVLLIAASLTLPFVLLKTSKWHDLLKTNQPKTSYTLALCSFLIGMGASLFTPARAGELARVACFPKRRLEVFTLVLIDKFIDMKALLGVCLLSLMLLAPWLGLVSIFGLGCLWLLVYTGFSLTKSAKWISHKPWLAERFRLLRQLPRRLIAFNACFACACLGLMALQFYLLLSSLQSVGWQVGLMLPIILVVSSLPISIMGLGLREGTAALLLSRYGVPMEAAVAAAFSLFVINALLPGLIGLALSLTLLKAHEGQKKVGERKVGSKDGWTDLKGLFHASRIGAGMPLPLRLEVLKMVDSETLTPLHESNQAIEVSVVIPCLNEAQSVGICVKKARNALKRLGICGEVVVADNGSTDGSAAIAEREGARVVHQPVRGYGSAYLAGIGAAQGKYIIMGDADDTYDFSNLEPFITPLRNGFDFVIGSRFQGNIHPGAMSWSHRYVGNPILSGILNLFFGADISDSHCGMRSFTQDAFERMKLQTLGMEFASEMVMRAIKGGLKVLEIPIDYYPRKGESKLNSFRDAWRHLRFMLLYSPTYLFLIPGALLFLLGLLCTFLLLPGPVKIGGHAYDVHVMTVTSLLTLLGYQILHVGIYAKTYALRCGFEESDRFISGLYQIFNLERGLVVGGILFMFGFAMDARIAYQWVQSGFGPLDQIRPAILASVFMVLGVQTFFSAFFLSLLGIETQNSSSLSSQRKIDV